MENVEINFSGLKLNHLPRIMAILKKVKILKDSHVERVTILFTFLMRVGYTLLHWKGKGKDIFNDNTFYYIRNTKN
jgi:hypothetical protein